LGRVKAKGVVQAKRTPGKEKTTTKGNRRGVLCQKKGQRVKVNGTATSPKGKSGLWAVGDRQGVNEGGGSVGGRKKEESGALEEGMENEKQNRRKVVVQGRGLIGSKRRKEETIQTELGVLVLSKRAV